ncbi:MULTISPECIES: YhhA family cyclophane-containing RiPP [Pectobacterium]|uniref:YhhA family cyclophane-containing RiPP n=1 Tax=Pectobacterium TaxID=122277 RepID=UPI00142893E6|nr:MULTISPECIES: YhhA family cyclophane-containing RiPP [Pectobacterium]MDC9818483.1 hypothetical protein [Pectobacterium polonicum]
MKSENTAKKPIENKAVTIKNNAVLARLMEEVRHEKDIMANSRYDRVHNRHNR